MRRFQPCVCLLSEARARWHACAALPSTGKRRWAWNCAPHPKGFPGNVRLLFPVAVSLLLLTSAHAAEPTTDSELPAGTQRMAEILERVIGAIEPLQNPYDSRARVQQMRREDK